MSVRGNLRQRSLHAGYEKSGVLESALSSMKTVESATAERPAVVLDAEAQLAD